MRKAGIKAEFLLLRTPSLSEAESVTKFADISLNSEITVIKKLSQFASKQNRMHKSSMKSHGINLIFVQPRTNKNI